MRNISYWTAAWFITMIERPAGRVHGLLIYRSAKKLSTIIEIDRATRLARSAAIAQIADYDDRNLKHVDQGHIA